MSRTVRNIPHNQFCFLRRPKTHNEIMNITGIINDIKVGEYKHYPVSGVNRMHRRKNIPDSHYDQRISALYETFEEF